MEPKALKALFIKSFFLMFSLFISGCEKEEEPFKSYLRMTLDGEKVECDHYIRASNFVPPNTSPTQLLGIYGTWKHNKPDQGSIEIELYFFDHTVGQKTFTSPSHVRVILKQGEYYGSENDVNLTILEVSERYVKGVFDVTVKKNTGPGTYDSLVITDGEFHIDRKM